MSAPRPRMHWAADALLSPVVLTGTGVAAYVGMLVCFALALLVHSWGIAVVIDVTVLLLLLALTVRGTWRLGYRVTPYAAAAAPLLWLLGFRPAVLLH